ncbi:MAG TPA: peptide chain release factor N(5)-glutamine methyltransferase [Candidatus Latescibacteria bacterium]|nr:peptide chain release factor N(5)-glutamine methyltransferase [Candidatus Latescibacterota bacterium]HJP34326.1 peptide chain release factor N(5)-glutamine methyltransferase [Candidatus Latescibacterota bacterium]
MSEERTWKLLDLLGEATGFLASKGLESSRLEAECMLAAALDVRRIDLYLQFERVLTAIEVEGFRSLVRQRLTGRPLQYITGDAGFRLLDLQVDERVLVPRPETEILVEEALDFLGEEPTGEILDVGCGSGAIAVSVARECEAARVLATDVSRPALAVARGNAERHGVAERIGFLCGDLLAPLLTGARFGAILSNPPYIASAEIADLQPEVRDHEPRLALDGGEDGLDLIRRLVPLAAAHLLPGGRLLLEVGSGQSGTVEALLKDAGFEASSVSTRPDLAGIPRVVTGAMPI